MTETTIALAVLVRTAFPAKRYVLRAPLVLATALLAWRTLAAIEGRLGHAGAALDDAYIHFQYARALAEGHPLRYHAGDPVSTGATSLLWPALLAPFWLLGLRGDALTWAAWALSFVALALLAVEAWRLTLPLAGRTAALAAAALVLAFGGHVWCAASGMEVVPFAWAFARTLRLASDTTEDAARARRPIELAVFALLAFLLRPEGAIAAACAAVALLVGRDAPPLASRAGLRARAWALAPAAVVACAPLLAAASTTAQVKLLSASPYFDGAGLREAVLLNLRVFFGTLLQGQIWSAEFVPAWGAPIAMLGLASVVALGVRTSRPWRAAFVLVFALSMLAPCAYVTFLWNRLRYLWPFATGWLVALACLARVAGDLAARVHPRFRVVTPLLAFGFVGLFAAKLDGVIDDVAQSASGIDRQHVALGRWAAGLPSGALVGVNDTGAIAYFGEHRTFDVVGLTTPGEGRYWVAGAAPRFEHYERLSRELRPLPTHFIVYPEWLGIDAVLGRELFAATVTDATILGGQSMRAYDADWSALGTGERPWTPLGAASPAPLDAVDVADLESEAEHRYELLGARDGETIVRDEVPGDVASALLVADGGRTNRRAERFVAHLHAGSATRALVRIESAAPTRLHVRAGGSEVAALDVVPGPWLELAFTIPADKTAAATVVEVSSDTAAVSVFHYWFYDAASVTLTSPPG